ncbi:MAG TPA: MMPL family transporter, partial [Methylomirabilota bacterium]|nr:MMPL family transporter [Methylomirabilota bacterium]
MVALLWIPVVWQSARTPMGAETRTLLEGDQRTRSSYEKVREFLDSVEVLLVDVEHPDVFSAEAIAAVRSLSETFLRQPGVIDVKSLTHSSKPVREGFGFGMVPLVSANPDEAERAALREFCLEHPLVRNVLVSADARHTMITVTFRSGFEGAGTQAAFARKVESMLAPFRGQGLMLRALALPLVEHEIRETVAADVRRVAPIAVGVVLVILWLAFRSLPMVAVVLINLGLGLAALPALLVALGASINFFTVMLFPLIGGIHLSLLTHVASACLKTPAPDAVEQAISDTFTACLFAALTTGGALLSLTLSDVSVVREFGGAGAAGVGMVFLLTFGPGLAMLKIWWRFWGRTGGRGQDSKIPATHGHGGLPVRVAGFVQRWRWVVIGCAAMAVIVAGVGLTRIRTDIRAVEFLDRESPVRQAVETLDAAYGGIQVLRIELDSGRPDGINTPAFLRYMEEVRRHASSLPGVSGAYSYAQVLGMMRQIWEGGSGLDFRPPESPLLIRMFAVALGSRDFPFVEALADPAYQRGYLVVRSRQLPADEHLAMVREVVRFAEAERPEGVEVSAAEGIHSVLEADRRILRSQGSSAGVTVAAVAVLLAGLWRSARLAAWTVLANVAPVVCVLGLAGFVGVALNAVTVMLAAVAMGIAVDDSVHLVTHWRGMRRAGADSMAALAGALAVKGRPI